MSRLYLSLLLSLLIASSASAVTMDWTFIGDPGNPVDTEVMNDGTTGYGSVSSTYYIGTYEVTNAQYVEFLNAKAASDPYALYNPTTCCYYYSGITRSGSDGSYTYSAIAGRDNWPVNDVSFYDALRFANWINNGKGSGDTETGSYTLLGGTPSPSNGNTVSRNAGAEIFLPNENEWYKAAYYDSSTSSYFDYPAGSNTQTSCSAPTAVPNHANCGYAYGTITAAGSYVGSASPFGTFDQGGNVGEWNETIVEPTQSVNYRGARGASYGDNAATLAASYREFGYGVNPTNETGGLGFRLAMIPEPSTGLLVIAGLLGFGVRRRMRA